MMQKNIILHKVPSLRGVFQLFSSPVFVGVGVAELLGAGFSAQLQQCQTCARSGAGSTSDIPTSAQHP